MTGLPDANRTDRDVILERIISEQIGERRRLGSDPPLAWLIAGPPGAGKSRLAEVAIQTSAANGESAIRIDADALRIYHADYAISASIDPAMAFEMTQSSASRWADALRDAAITRRLDVAIEGLFKTPRNTRTLCQRLAGQRYRTTLQLKLVPEVLSLLQIERRYERQLAGYGRREAIPRRVDADAHRVGNDAIDPLLRLVEESSLVSRIEIFDAENTLVYGAQPSAALEASRFVRGWRQAPISPELHSLAIEIATEVIARRASRGVTGEGEPGSALERALTFLVAD